MSKLVKKTVFGFVGLIIALGIALFAPAWTLDFWQAWVFLALFAVCTLFVTVYLWFHDKKLLERRVNSGPIAEKEKSQKIIQSFASLAFISMLIVPSLDHRFAWSQMPTSAVLIGDAMVVLGLGLVFLVLRVNTYTSATIQVEQDQKLVTSGPYGIVRHPMYACAMIMIMGMPLALGSWWGIICAFVLFFVIILRLQDEEKFLLANLEGYDEYRKKVRYRLIPYIF